MAKELTFQTYNCKNIWISKIPHSKEKLLLIEKKKNKSSVVAKIIVRNKIKKAVKILKLTSLNFKAKNFIKENTHPVTKVANCRAN